MSGTRMLFIMILNDFLSDTHTHTRVNPKGRKRLFKLLPVNKLCSKLIILLIIFTLCCVRRPGGSGRTRTCQLTRWWWTSYKQLLVQVRGPDIINKRKKTKLIF